MVDVISQAPTILCFLFIMFNFLRLTIVGIYRAIRKIEDKPTIASVLQQQHVAELLSKPVEIE